ncbi:hypothetical protein GGX14DRAFT_404530 [Mycena pura]|uniref:Uncharacterized protein n=1 Tax=Mycena pura TaxID=153505 RepID=A0AAD6UUD9_9AGAR|nr:hypothetical protein GGX14DRAFT_404530 [Mycena pura]
MKRKRTEAIDEPPVKQRVGRPQKNTTPPPPTKLTLKIPRARQNSTAISTTSTSDSDVRMGSTLEKPSASSSATSLVDDDELEMVQTATAALLGMASRRHADLVESDDEDMEQQEEEEEEEEEEAEDEEDEENKHILLNVATDDFYQTLADEMDVRRRDLKIGYKFSSWKAKELADSGKRKAKFQVEILDLVEKKTLEKISGKKERKRARKENNSSDDEERDGEQLNKKTGAGCLRELEATHSCDKHGGFWLVAKDGERTHRALWSAIESMEFAHGSHKSVTKAPEVLNLPLNGSKAVPVPRRSHQMAAQPAPFQYNPYYPPPFAPYYPPPPPPPPPAPPSAPTPSSPATSQNPPQHSVLRQATSIDSQDDDPPTIYPTVDDWLLDLNTGDRGEDGHHFLLFSAALRKQGFAHMSQLANEGADGVETLQRICPDMKLGTAKLLMKYAVKDCKAIRKIERERKAAWAS